MELKNFTCTYEGCLREYSNAFNLKRHIESYHLCLKKFICEICHKGLSSKQNMREHYFIHEGVKPYNCTVRGCNQSFRQLSQLKLHKKFHNAIVKHLENQKIKFSVNSSVFSKHLSKISLEKPVDNEMIEIPRLEVRTSKVFFELEKMLNSGKT